MNRKPRRLIAVLACLAALALAVSLVVVKRSGPASAAGQSGYCAMMPDAVGLYRGNPVTTMGYNIGIVTAVTPADTAVRVDFRIDHPRRLPADVKAVTRSKSVLADRSLELVDVTSLAKGGAAVSQRPALQPGTCIALGDTYTPASISEIAGSAADLIQRIAPDGDVRAIEGTIAGLAEAFEGSGDELGTFMRTASQAAQSPDRFISDIGTIITSTAPLTADALANWADIASIMNKLAPAADVAARVLWPGTVRMIYGMKPVLQFIYDFERKYGTELYAILDALPPLIHIAATKVPDIQRALGVLPVVATTASVVASRDKGAAVQVAQPWIRSEVGDPAAFCRNLNKVRPGSCLADGRRARAVRVRAFDLLIGALR